MNNFRAFITVMAIAKYKHERHSQCQAIECDSKPPPDQSHTAKE